MEYEMKTTASSLLQMITEFVALNPDPREWSFEAQHHNPPGMKRLKMIESLFRAFLPGGAASGHPDRDIQSFLYGDFIMRRDLASYSELTALMQERIARSRFSHMEKMPVDLSALQNNFVRLLRFRQQYGRLLRHNDSIMEISYPCFFSYVVTDDILSAIRDREDETDRYLALFIDPGKRSYGTEELVKLFDYPAGDPAENDFDRE